MQTRVKKAVAGSRPDKRGVDSICRMAGLVSAAKRVAQPFATCCTLFNTLFLPDSRTIDGRPATKMKMANNPGLILKIRLVHGLSSDGRAL
jgi:hypothetical protein